MENAQKLNKDEISCFFKRGGRCVVRIGDTYWGRPVLRDECSVRVYYGITSARTKSTPRTG